MSLHYVFMPIFQTSVFELARTPDFASLPLIPEDYIKDNGAQYSCKFIHTIQPINAHVHGWVHNASKANYTSLFHVN